MFGRRTTVVSINKYLDAYQQNESLPAKLYKNFSSSLLKAVRKCEAEVAAKLEEGNPDNHARHEEYVLSFIQEPLKTEIYAHINRGITNAHTLISLKTIMTNDSWSDLLQGLEICAKMIYVNPKNCIFDPSAQSSDKWAGLLFLRHGEGYYVENSAHCDFAFLDCMDMLGVTDHAFINSDEIPFERVQIVSSSACLVGIITFIQLIDVVKALNTTENEINEVVSFLLARSVRLAKEEERNKQEEEMKRQLTQQKHLSDWKDHLRAGDVKNVGRYVEGGFDVNSDIGALRDKPIIIAMASKSIETLRYLCDHGADVNAVNENGTTALHICCQIGWIEGIKVLIGKSAKMMQDKQGNSPLHIAAQQENEEVIRLFIKMRMEGIQGIDWMMKNTDGERVYNCCISLELKRIIIPKGVKGYCFERLTVC